MAKGNKKVFLLTGHKHWGKSRTLSVKSFAGNKLHIYINETKVIVIKRSNDDIKGKLLNSIKKHLNKPYIIIAFCANFTGGYFTVDILDLLKKNGYEIFSFVLSHKYDDPKIMVSDEEINKLKQYSKVEIYSEIKKKDNIRAAEFKKYLEKNIP
jgi:uncharacterized protein YvpB